MGEDAKNVDNSLIAAYEDEHGSAHESDEHADEPHVDGLNKKCVAPSTLAKGAKGNAKKRRTRTVVASDDDDSVD